MRWHFPNDTTGEERTARAATHAHIDAWWRAFAARADEIRAASDRMRSARDADPSLAPFVASHLAAIHPTLGWEMGPGRNGQRRLVITCEHLTHLRPLVATVIARAPSIPGWELCSERQPASVAEARLIVRGRTGGDLDALRVNLLPGAHHRIDVVYAPARGMNEMTASVALEALLGERVLNDWIGRIGPAPHSFGQRIARLLGGRAASDFLGPDVIVEAVAAEIDRTRAQLPRHPRWIDDEEAVLAPAPDGRVQVGCVFERHPTPSLDYAGWDDLYVASAPDPDLWRAQHAPGFASERFSRHGESFAYLKIEHRNGAGPTDVHGRAAISEPLDTALQAAQLGATVGGGFGRCYCYIELALANLDASVALVQETLRQLGVGPRSWILFHDAALHAEWIGIHPDSPLPFGL